MNLTRACAHASVCLLACQCYRGDQCLPPVGHGLASVHSLSTAGTLVGLSESEIGPVSARVSHIPRGSAVSFWIILISKSAFPKKSPSPTRPGGLGFQLVTYPSPTRSRLQVSSWRGSRARHLRRGPCIPLRVSCAAGRSAR